MNGELLKELRLKANLTQEELGEKIGFTGAAIRMLEIGKRKGSRKMIEKLAAFFEVPIDYLYNSEKYKEDISSRLITKLIKNGIITDSKKIDKDTQDMIIFAIQTEINKKLELIKNKSDS